MTEVTYIGDLIHNEIDIHDFGKFQTVVSILAIQLAVHTNDFACMCWAQKFRQYL